MFIPISGCVFIPISWMVCFYFSARFEWHTGILFNWNVIQPRTCATKTRKECSSQSSISLVSSHNSVFSLIHFKIVFIYTHRHCIELDQIPHEIVIMMTKTKSIKNSKLKMSIQTHTHYTWNAGKWDRYFVVGILISQKLFQKSLDQRHRTISLEQIESFPLTLFSLFNLGKRKDRCNKMSMQMRSTRV